MKVLFYQALRRIFIFHRRTEQATPWSAERKGRVLSGLGDQGLLQGPLIAFFASRQCPGSAIRAATAWALQQARERRTLISGFHSPLEQSVLRLLTEGGGIVVLVLARPVATASLRSTWHGALDAGRMAVVCQATRVIRLTEKAAEHRNELAARLADEVVIAHASTGGRLGQQCERWRAEGRNVRQLS